MAQVIKLPELSFQLNPAIRIGEEITSEKKGLGNFLFRGKSKVLLAN